MPVLRFHYLLIFLSFGLTSCATLFTGSRGIVTVHSNASNAKVTINGKERGQTPLRVKLWKGRDQFIQVEAEGYVPQTYVLKRKTQLGFLISEAIPNPLLLYTPPLALLTDFITGGIYRFRKDSVHVRLNQPGDSLDLLEQQKRLVEQLKKQQTDSLRVVRRQRDSLRYVQYKERVAREQQYLDSLRPRWNLISLNGPQFLLREGQLSFEKFISHRWSIEGVYGYRFYDKDAESISTSNYYTTPDDIMPFFPFAQSHMGSLMLLKNLRINTHPVTYGYMGLGVFYRYNFYEDKSIVWDLGVYDEEYGIRQSQRQQIYGIKYRIGIKSLQFL